MLVRRFFPSAMIALILAALAALVLVGCGDKEEPEGAQPTPSADAAAGGDRGGKRDSRPEVFKYLDRNEDGKVTKDETAGAPGMGQVIQKADSNKDGALSLEEASAYEAQSGDGGPGGGESGDR